MRAAYYSRSAGTTDRVTVMAQGSTSPTQATEMTVNVNGVNVPMSKDFNRYYGTVAVDGTFPAQISVTATDNGFPSVPNTLTVALKDLVIVSKADAICSGTGANKSCVLSVQAASSDDGSGAEAPVLTVQHANAVLVGGAASIVTPAVPASVTVTSSKGGVAVKPVTIINQ